MYFIEQVNRDQSQLGQPHLFHLCMDVGKFTAASTYILMYIHAMGCNGIPSAGRVKANTSATLLALSFLLLSYAAPKSLSKKLQGGKEVWG